MGDYYIMIFEDRDLVYLDYLCGGKPIQLNKLDLESGVWVEKKNFALSKNIDMIPVNLGSRKKDNSGWTLLDIRNSEKDLVFSDNLSTIYRGGSFINAIEILLNSKKHSLLLILDEHKNLKGVLNKDDLTNLYFVSRVYVSLHVLEVLGYQAISLLPGNYSDFYKSYDNYNNYIKRDEAISLLDILNYLAKFLILNDNNLYFKFEPSENRSIERTNESIYKLRNNTMHPRVRGKTSFRIDKAFLRDFTYIENAIKDLVCFCKN